MAIGQELLDIPIADMVRNLAAAVAEGQFALDQSSIATLKFLIDNKVDLIPEVSEIIQRVTRNVPLSDAEDAPTVSVDSVGVTSVPAPPVSTSLLQAGILPTFYQFTEASIEVKLSITMRQTSDAEANGRPGFGNRRVLAFASPVNFRSKNTFSYDATGSTTLRITMRPVPPPPRLLPDIVAVNTLTTPPTVTRTER